jgi:hypothetical protein
MKIALITDIHLGDYRRNQDFDTCKLALLKQEFDFSHPDIIVNTADTVSLDKYLRPEASKETYWEQYLEFKAALDCQIIEVCINREKDFFASMFGLPGVYYRTDFADCSFFSIAPEFDYDHTLSSKQLNWLENEFKNTASRWQFILSHVPVEQATERSPGPGIYLSDSERLKEIACQYGKHTFFVGGHFHQMPIPKTEGKISMIMGGIADNLNPQKNDLTVRYLNINEPQDKINLESVKIDILSGRKKQDGTKYYFS